MRSRRWRGAVPLPCAYPLGKLETWAFCLLKKSVMRKLTSNFHKFSFRTGNWNKYSNSSSGAGRGSWVDIGILIPDSNLLRIFQYYS